MSDTRTAPQGNGAEPRQEVALRQQEPAGFSLMPHDMGEAIQLAKMMASARMVPKHLQGDVGTCLMVIEQALRWRMSPFAVAQGTSSIGGKMMFEGKLVAAAVETSGAIEGGFDYQFTGTGDNRTITVSARRRGEAAPRTIDIRLGDVKTTNEWWRKQPDQQLVYSGSRNWARRWTPSVILGVYSPEEFGRNVDAVVDNFGGKTIEGNAQTDEADVTEAVQDAPPPPAPAYEWPSLQEPDGTKWLANFLRVADECTSTEEVTELAKHSTVSLALAKAPARVKRDIEEKLADTWALFEKPAPDGKGGPEWDDGSSAAEPGSLDGVMPEELQNPPAPADQAEQEAALLIAAYRGSTTRQALDSLKNSMRADVTIKMLTNKGDGVWLKRLDDAYEARSAELRAKPETPPA